MADENQAAEPTDTIVAPTTEKADTPKETRVSRKSKMLSAGGEVVVAGEAPKKTRKKRGEGTAAVVVTKAPKGGRKSVATSTAAETSADSLDDLVQLEQENIRLRAALADKLRAENADLRKKLAV